MELALRSEEQPVGKECRSYSSTDQQKKICCPAISGRENCASFAVPLYRDGKTARVLLSRYIGTKKLRESTRRETAPGPPGHLVYVHFLSEHACDTTRR